MVDPPDALENTPDKEVRKLYNNFGRPALLITLLCPIFSAHQPATGARYPQGRARHTLIVCLDSPLSNLNTPNVNQELATRKRVRLTRAAEEKVSAPTHW